ncbi:MAG: hypothetical protein PF569_00430 [Candidatus Woesearchaeota archaeon]|jgi:hypothetical protein|nr:hypothetical protein [Candidatus Woesearchaeota archaeon]
MGKLIKLVCASDDGVNFSREHFGSAKKYLFYTLNLDSGEIIFLKEINNSTPDERGHADPEKAKAVSDFLSDAKILINFVFGPNIVKMRKKFVPIISKEENIDIALGKINEVLENIVSTIDNNGDKDILYINK